MIYWLKCVVHCVTNWRIVSVGPHCEFITSAGLSLHTVCLAACEGLGICDLSSATTTLYSPIKVAVVSVLSPCFPPQCSPWTDKAYVSPNQAASPSFSTTPLSTYTTSSVPDRCVCTCKVHWFHQGRQIFY